MVLIYLCNIIIGEPGELMETVWHCRHLQRALVGC
uniref:Uncharacterized protein n=1 Tax=Angiostrongylus cantonensis TaxID=6313 RepID=A0A0K0DD46_ANGCA